MLEHLIDEACLLGPSPTKPSLRQAMAAFRRRQAFPGSTFTSACQMVCDDMIGVLLELSWPTYALFI